jgi:CubicO group peptidase (beta-lactamase class C family)
MILFLGKVVEAVSGMTLDEYVQKTFYTPLGLTTAGFKPINRFPQWRVIPTETESFFRLQTIKRRCT